MTCQTHPWSPPHLALLGALSAALQAQAPPPDKPLADMSLEELAQVEVSVASRTALAPRMAPGIVTLVTRDDIRESGARDLIDVLRLVPGFEFGIDVRGVTSIGIRGNWAHEGKVLLLWDGEMMNEVLFPSVQIGSHYPVDLIERIEVVRGPGSAVYGGNAELGVINIVTVGAAGLDGTVASVTAGWMARGGTRKGTSLSLGTKGDDFAFDCSLHAGDGSRSDRIFEDYHPENPWHAFPMAHQETLDDVMLSLGLRYRDFRARVIVDQYHLNDRTMYGQNLPSSPRIDFLSRLVDAAYEVRVGDGIRITPRLTYTQNTPWQCLDANYRPPVYLDKWAERLASSVTLEAEPRPGLSLLSGLEHFVDRGHAGPDTYFSRDPGRKTLEYSSSSAFLQGLWKGQAGSLTLGARFEHNSVGGNAFVPRIALTRTMGPCHVKLLYSYAFRAPGIENISRYASTPIGPERTRVAELEAGWQASPRLSFTINAFDIVIKDPIVFDLDPVLNLPAYHNGTRTGTSGLEAVCRYKSNVLDATLTHSTYRSHCNEVHDYLVDADPRVLLGFARHKTTFNATWRPAPGLSLNVSGTRLGQRWADNDVTHRQYAAAPVLLLNLWGTLALPGLEGLTLEGGVYNLTDATYSFIQPYRGGSAPLPGPSREALLKLSYQRRL